ncbi:MAG: hypothetical protein RLZZ385_665 [Pseudomonadota bacterium]|jgi:predicted metal-dependent phosphoesterase TrpH
MTFDLHCHSHYSDGQHAPELVMQRAVTNGVTHLAFTDHDVLAADADVPLPYPLRIVPGVEISTLHEGREIHVVGLGLRSSDPELRELLSSQQAARWQRLQAMDRLLTQARLPGLADRVADLPTLAPSRTHVADFLVSLGVCKDRSRAFQTHLGRQGRFYVKPQWCSMQMAIKTIQAAGGLAVLAHPHRYASTMSGLRRLVGEFSELGGDAMEVACANIDPGTLDRLANSCTQMGLLASCGSDFHSQSATWMDVGRLPELPQQCKKNAIWLAAGWHL